MGRSAVVDWGEVGKTVVVSWDDVVYGVRSCFSAEITISFISS
jgi:hypothetical protein